MEALTLDQAAERLSGMLAPETETPEPAEAVQPEESSEPEEADATDEAEAEPDAEQQEEAEQPKEGHLQVIEFDGEKIPVEQLRQERLRHADYTRKTMELAEQRKAFESHMAALSQERQLYADLIPALQKHLEEPEPDWETLRKTNPEEAMSAYIGWQKKKEAQVLAAQESQRISALRSQEAAQAQQQQLQSEYALLVSAIPEWKNPETAKTEMNKLIETAKGFGFSDAELANFNDHRSILVLRKAAQAIEQEKRVKAVKPADPKIAVAKPGLSAKKAPSELDSAKRRLAQTGRVEDAAAVLRHYL